MKNNHNKILILILLAAFLTIFSACSAPPDIALTEAVIVEINHNVSADEAAQLIDDGAFILDVRTIEEWNQAHIHGSVLIPHNIISNYLNEVPSDAKVLIYCRSGNRSAQALDVLLGEGYTEVYNLLGGMNEWTAAGYPVD